MLTTFVPIVFVINLSKSRSTLNNFTINFMESISCMFAGAIRQTMCGPTKMQKIMSPGLMRVTGVLDPEAKQDFSRMQPN